MRKSAGVLLYRRVKDELEFFLVHPGGPFWKNKDEGAWTIPKGEFTDEEPLQAALREFEEETGIKTDLTSPLELTPVVQKNGKKIYAFAFEKNVTTDIKSNLCVIEFPPRSGKKISIPEADKAGWFNISEVKSKIIPAQFAFITELQKILSAKSGKRIDKD